MTRAVLTVTFGAFLINLIVIGIFLFLPIEEPSITGLISIFAASTFAGGQFVKRNNRIMQKGERWACGFYSALLSLVLTAVVLGLTFLIGLYFFADNELGDLSFADFGMSAGTVGIAAIIIIVVFTGLNMLLVYWGTGTGQKDAAKKLVTNVEETFE